MENLKSDIIQKATNEKFSGVISIFQGANEIINEAFGLRNAAENIPNEVSTKFGIASGTKLFTSLGIGKLIDSGKLEMETRIREIDKEFCTFIDGDATIKNLLTHTSGIYDYYDEEINTDFDNFFVEIPWYQLENPSDYLPLFFRNKPKFRPSERFSYSNGGYVFLGILIEKFSGQKYRDYITEQILRPCRMENSGFFALNDLPANSANGYKDDRSTTNVYNIPIRGGGDGGMFTNTYDLRKFWEELFSFRILPEKLTHEFTSTHYKFSKTSGYGCGIYKQIDSSMYSIVGGDAGVGFDSRFLPKQGIIINILSNITDGENEIRSFILAHINELSSI